MIAGRVSIIIPSCKERFLPQTIHDLLSKAHGDVEIIAVLDGYWPDPRIVEDRRVILLHRGVQLGMRAGINAAVQVARGEYLLKIDAHCMVADGYDMTLRADCADNWVVVPRRYSLDPEAWAIKQTGKAPVDAHYLSYPYEAGRAGVGLHGTVWGDRQRARQHVLIDDEMSSQGSCWFMTRAWWDRRFGALDATHYGSFIQEFQEIGCKTWLGGGEVKVNKQTWYAHLHKGKEYGRGYFISKGEMSEGSKFAVVHWMNDQWADRQRDFRWLVEHFWPVPGWPTAGGALDWDVVARGTAEFTARIDAGLPVPI